MENYSTTIQAGAPAGATGYQIEVQRAGQLPMRLPPGAGAFSLQPFEQPEGAPRGRHRVLYCKPGGARISLEPGRDVLVDLDPGLHAAAPDAQTPTSAVPAFRMDTSPARRLRSEIRTGFEGKQ